MLIGINLLVLEAKSYGLSQLVVSGGTATGASIFDVNSQMKRISVTLLQDFANIPAPGSINVIGSAAVKDELSTMNRQFLLNLEFVENVSNFHPSPTLRRHRSALLTLLHLNSTLAYFFSKFNAIRELTAFSSTFIKLLFYAFDRVEDQCTINDPFDRCKARIDATCLTPLIYCSSFSSALLQLDLGANFASIYSSNRETDRCKN